MSRTQLPHCTATHDGRIWTRPRHQMTSAAAIRQRMAQEARAEIARTGLDAVITADDYRQRGWTEPQISMHLATAIDMATCGAGRNAA